MHSGPTIPGFSQQRVPAADGIELNVAVGGSGSPVVLLHGFPQTHLMWRHVADDLAAEALHAEALGVRVTAVLGARSTLLVSHCSVL